MGDYINIYTGKETDERTKDTYAKFMFPATIPYSLANIKTFKGMEQTGCGLNADLKHDGRKVAFALDEDCGGELMLTFTNPADEAAFKAYLATLPLAWQFGAMKHPDANDLITELVNRWEQAKEAKRKERMLAKQITWEAKDGHTYSVKVLPTEANKARVMARYGAEIVRFLNPSFQTA